MSAPGNAAEVEVQVEATLPPGVDPGRLRRLVLFALDAEGQGSDWSVAVALVDDDALRGLHARFMGIDEQTDCMTFPAEGFDGEPSGGDIVISVDRAAEQGPEHGVSAAGEIDFLAVHCALHLCGWDDATDDDRAAMHLRQHEIIADFVERGG
jgi:probable rRNA maturation factor